MLSVENEMSVCLYPIISIVFDGAESLGSETSQCCAHLC